MRKIVVLDAATLGNDLDLSGLREFGELTVYPSTTSENAAERLAGAQIVVLNKVKLTAGILSKATELKLICETATGFDNIDLDYCRSKGIAVCNVVGYSTPCVAQLTVTMALSLITRIDEFKTFVESGEYTRAGIANRLEPVFHEIAGKTWGIIGYGNIGRQVGKVADALGCHVLVCKKTPISERECVDLETICRKSDILSVHTPLNEETKHLLDREHIAMMKPTAILINVARGAVTDEQALADAIRTGKLGGLGVDVYSQEPFPQDHPFWKIKSFPNVLLTPHMAWGASETRIRLMQEIEENIRSFFAGNFRNRVDLR